MMGKYKFSIVIPVYNVEQYLERCMDSVLAQNYENIEVILIDDGSSDKSGELCNQYAQQHEKIRVIHKENGGLSSARNIGIKMATGDYLLFLDSDDYIEEKMCYKLAVYLEQYPGVDVISIDGYEDTGQKKKGMRRLAVDNVRCMGGEEYLIQQYSQRNMNVEAWLYLFKKDFLVQGGFEFEKGILHEDVEFTPRVIEQARFVLEVPDKLYHYMVREGSISTQKDKTKNILDLFHTLEKMEAHVKQISNKELRKWTNDAILNSYLNMIQEARMYQRRYRHMINKSFVIGKSATIRNHLRTILFLLSVRLYCNINSLYKIRSKEKG